ncbi:Part of AAA domain-containing protein [Lachnospiraceae bacterium]|nr:Part of AAA domain-containing protein [Lachnospiraceae bacterium]
MGNEKLERLAKELLDTGKRNNLVNFKDHKASTAEIVCPDAETFFEKCFSTSVFEIYDPKITDDEDEIAGIEDSEVNTDETDARSIKRQEYIERYSAKLTKNSQILVFAQDTDPIKTIKNIDKKAASQLEETGVNVAYMAFGFVRWKESENSDIVNRAPLLLIPIRFRNESAVSPYYIEPLEDEVVVNPTFQYILKAQFGIELPEFPEDEGLASYLEKVREIVSKLKWEVVSECKIGIFSFAKINMYHDLMDNQDIILKNPNVQRLLGEHVADAGVGPASVPTGGETKNEIIDLHTVVDADSSQIEAIEMAKAGQSFVLQGPPGTGKSQTITNIIAECLYDGRKVLFVSEKIAALNVVYDKLKKNGLEEFCLELHSQKASKKQVIEELCKTLKASKSSVSSKADAEVRAKAEAQAQLDTYAEELHKPIPGINRSMYQLYNAYSAHRNAPDMEPILTGISAKDEAYLNEAVNLLKQYEQYVPLVGAEYRSNVWYGFKGQDGSFEARSRLKQNIQGLSAEVDNLIKKIEICDSSYGIETGSLDRAEMYQKMFQVISGTSILRPNAFMPENLKIFSDTVNKLAEICTRLIPIKQRLSDNFDDRIYAVNGSDYYDRLTKLYSGFFSRLFSKDYKNILADIRVASKRGDKISYKEACEYMKLLMDHQYLMGQFSAEKKNIADLELSEELTINIDWEKLKIDVGIVGSCFEKGVTGGNIAFMSDDKFRAEKPVLGKHASDLSDSLNKLRSGIAELQEYFDPSVIFFGGMELPYLSERLKSYEGSIDKLQNWINFSILLRQLGARDLLRFIDKTVEQKIDTDKITDTYQKLFFRQWISHVMSSDPVFAGFTRVSQDRAVEVFSEKDRLQFEISKARIKAELSAKRPSLDMIAGGSAVSILIREGEKKRKQKSIRKIFEEAGELVQVLKPCFLMSPLSVSTFLSENSITFDTVVFDEASQIFPQDAIGAIYRGKQVIVVGDSRQMPPSNFFNSAVEMDSDEEDVTDFESILDLCSASFPQKRLRWHYRSRYEQLISYSNKNFYDNSLVTFPSSVVDHEGVGVDYYHVDGIFDRKSHTNRDEAAYVVDLVFKNIERYPNRSLGVVAFSVAQQDVIDKLLNKRRQEDPSYEWFFKKDETVKEPFFIKNLETVQGDERDTIIFSVAYGRDSAGKLLHNFGPLNRVGGERRLNVAVTRAKENIQVVSSMHHTDIDPSRSSAEGVRLLKEYLDYAENGDIALSRSITADPLEQSDTEFEMEVYDFLKEKGFAVDAQVGRCGFRIDVGIRMPDSADYVLAVECDGADYHSEKNTRDRDRLRQDILERMGWRFYRIWSTDWFRNTEIEKERLFNAATEAVHLGPKNSQTVKESSADTVPSFETVIQVKAVSFPEYRDVDIENFGNLDLYSRQDVVKRVMEVEAPVSEEYLLRQISTMYGREKVTSVVKQYYESDMHGCEKNGIIRRNGFMYLADQTEFKLRVPGVKRDVKYIAPEELAAGLHFLIEQNVTAEKEGLYKALASQLGFTRMGDAIYTKFDEALTLLQDVDIKDNILSLKEN